jgi:hypothetical protein
VTFHENGAAWQQRQASPKRRPNHLSRDDVRRERERQQVEQLSPPSGEKRPLRKCNLSKKFW